MQYLLLRCPQLIDHLDLVQGMRLPCRGGNGCLHLLFGMIHHRIVDVGLMGGSSWWLARWLRPHPYYFATVRCYALSHEALRYSLHEWLRQHPCTRQNLRRSCAEKAIGAEKFIGAIKQAPAADHRVFRQRTSRRISQGLLVFHPGALNVFPISAEY